MRILHCVETLSRTAGGLPVAVVGLAVAQEAADRSCRCMIAATDTPQDALDRAAVNTAEVLSAQQQSLAKLLGVVAKQHREEAFTVVHQHGLWTPLSIASARFARKRCLPLIISPHGMLEPWARRHHALRKKVAWHLYQKRILQSAEALIASSPNEAEELRQLGFHQPIAIIPHGLAPIDAAEKQRSSDAPKLLMLSRIHPKKGIDMLLDAWADIDAPNWQLIIAGNDDGGHRATLEKQASDLGLGERVRFYGAVFDAQKEALFNSADLFVLPTHSENFGIAIAEALQHDLPVVTTTGTPWQQLATEGCGWCVEPTRQGIGTALAEAVKVPEAERLEMGARGAALIDRDYRWENVAALHLDLLRWLSDSDHQPRPAFMRED